MLDPEFAAAFNELLESDEPAEIFPLTEDTERTTMSADLLSTPLGRSGDRALVVLDPNADLLAPLLGGEPEPEDGHGMRWIPVGIPGLEMDPKQLADELADLPEDVWFVVPHSDAATDFHLALAEAMVAMGKSPPAPVLLPESLTLEALIRRLPVGEESVEMGSPSRNRLFARALALLWAANAPDEWLVPVVCAEADPLTSVGFV